MEKCLLVEEETNNLYPGHKELLGSAGSPDKLSSLAPLLMHAREPSRKAQ